MWCQELFTGYEGDTTIGNFRRDTPSEPERIPAPTGFVRNVPTRSVGNKVTYTRSESPSTEVDGSK